MFITALFLMIYCTDVNKYPRFRRTKKINININLNIGRHTPINVLCVYDLIYSNFVS